MEFFAQEKKKEKGNFEFCDLLSKRNVQENFAFCDEVSEQKAQNEQAFLFRQPKRIKRSIANEFAARRHFGLENLPAKSEFNERYRAKCFAEMQKYKEKMGRFN